MSDCSTFSGTNPDISGIGVRISFYLQTFLLVLLVDRSWQDAAIALWTFIATSFGLVVAAIVNRGQLTFFQALQVSNLVWLANFGTFVALASYSRQKASHRSKHKSSTGPREMDYGVKFGAMIQTILSMILTIYMWATAPSFGVQSGCSYLINYVLFVVKAPALHTGRIIGLVMSSLLTIAYCLITAHELRTYYATRRKGRVKHVDLESQSNNRRTDIRTSSVRSPSSLSPPSPRTFTPSQSDSSVTPASEAISRNTETLAPVSIPATPSTRRPRRRKWSFDLDPMLVGVIICQIAVFGYFIVSSELLLTYNQDTSDTDNRSNFGFGQILALIVVLPSFLSVIGALRENGFKRLKKKAPKARKKQKVVQPTVV